MKQWLLEVVARACQKVLDTDPVALHKLRCTIGQRMLMHITDKQLFVTCEMTEHGLSLVMANANADGSACAVLRGDIPAWLRCATWRRPGMSPGMVIEGDMGLAQTWQQVMHHINIDWAALLAPVLGDGISQFVADIGASTATHVRDVGKHRVQDTVEYAQEEVCVLPAYHEAQAFYGDVDRIRDDVARLKVRCDRLFAGKIEECA
jgi:ubiquinone biosynthesis protein UbiJ